MPDIGYEMQLRQRMQDPNSESSPMGALRALGNSVGSAWQGYEGRTDQADLMKFFMDKPVTPETVQEFKASHPRMPLMEIYQTAGTIQTQKKAQQAKDYFTTLQSYLSGGGDPDPETLQKMASKFTLLQPKEIMDMSTGIMKQTDFMATVKEKKKARENEIKASGAVSKLYSPQQIPEAAMYPVTDSDATMGGEAEYPAYTGETKMVTPKVSMSDVYQAIIPFANSMKDRVDLLKEWGKVDDEVQKDIMEVLKSQEYDDPSKKIIVDKIRTGKTAEIPFESLKRQPKETTTKNVDNYMGQDGGVVPIDKNNPQEVARIEREGLVPYTNPVKSDVHSPERFQQEKDLKAAGRQPTPPEIKPSAALKRMSAIKSAIARLNSGGSIDALLLAQIPEYAGLMASNDPEARKEAITQLQAELDYVKGFAPKGAPSASEVKPGGKILDKKTAMAIFEKAGRNKALAEKMAREQGYTF